MLTNDEFQEAQKLWGGTDCLAGKMVDELLTLREAVAPQMAEVDVATSIVAESRRTDRLWEQFKVKLDSLADIARTAILACEREKQRANEAEMELAESHGYSRGRDRLVGEMQSQIETLSTELSAIRDAGDEEVEIEDLLDSIPAPELNEKWVKLIGETECLRNDLRERDAEIERLKASSYLGSLGQSLLRSDEQIQSLQSRIETLTAERDEVVGLLKWMVKYWDLTGKLEGIAEGCVVEPWKENASKILVLCSKESPNAD